MIFHYAIWFWMAIMIIGTGALYRGQQDMTINQKVSEATAAVFISMPLKSLTEYKI